MPWGGNRREYLPYTVDASSPGAFRPSAVGEQADYFGGINTPANIPVETVIHIEIGFEGHPR